MLSEIPTALTALTNLKDLTKAIVSSKVEAALREQAIESGFAIIEAQGAISSLQTQYQSLLEEKDALKKQLIEMQNWDAESTKYELVQMIPGVFVYALKDDYKATAPPHWLCPNCYETAQKSILQRRYNRVHHNYGFSCQKCGIELLDPTNAAMPA
jgi:hypothetical protein